MKLRKVEQETIINFNQQDKVANVYTCSKTWMRHMENKLKLKPIKVYSHAREYECPKEWIRKPQKQRRMSDSQKKNLSHRFTPQSILDEKLASAQEKLEVNTNV